MTATRVSWTECLVVGVAVFGMLGTGSVFLLLAAFVAYIRTDASLWDDVDARLVLSAAAGAALSGTLAWRTVIRSRGPARWRGVAAGVIVGIVAHPLCWLIYGTASAVHERAKIGPTGVASFIFFGFVLGTLSSLVGLGWLTTPVCALLGFFTADVSASLHRESSAATPSVDR